MNKMYRKCCNKANDDPIYVRYLTYRNCYNKLKHTAKTNYFSRIFENYKNNSKETWKHLRTPIKGHGNKHDLTDSIKYEGKDNHRSK